jgi:hypothetical protein
LLFNNKSCIVGQKCPRKYRIEQCERTHKVRIYRFGNHSSTNLVNKQHALSKKVNEIFEDLIYNYDVRPQRIHAKAISQATTQLQHKTRTQKKNQPQQNQKKISSQPQSSQNQGARRPRKVTKALVIDEIDD